MNCIDKIKNFKSRRAQAIALRSLGWTYKEISSFMLISKKGVWMHVTSYCKLSKVAIAELNSLKKRRKKWKEK